MVVVLLGFGIEDEWRVAVDVGRLTFRDGPEVMERFMNCRVGRDCKHTKGDK